MKAVKLTRTIKAKEVAKRWGANYLDKNRQCNFIRGQEVYDELVALGPSPNPDDVDKIIGNKSWTEIKCNGCELSVEEGIQVGERNDPDWESNTVVLCYSCLQEVVEVFTECEKKTEEV